MVVDSAVTCAQAPPGESTLLPFATELAALAGEASRSVAPLGFEHLEEQAPLEGRGLLAALPDAERVDSGHPTFGLTDTIDPVDDVVGMYGEPWTWQLLPDDLIYHSYLAGNRESRFASVWAEDDVFGSVWDIALGGRVGVLRYGTPSNGPFGRPEGYQIDIEGAAFPRLDMDDGRDMVSTDFRFGIPVTYGAGPFQTKLAYYHLSSHLGDELLEKMPGAMRINYSRDVVVFGVSYDLTDNLRTYAEAGWAFYTSGGSEPWEFQFGVEYSRACPTGCLGSPFWAINGRLREEVDFGGNIVVQAGWQWRGAPNGHRFRVGGQYFNGKSDQYQFFREHEELFGLGLWYDY